MVVMFESVVMVHYLATTMLVYCSNGTWRCMDTNVLVIGVRYTMILNDRWGRLCDRRRSMASGGLIETPSAALAYMDPYALS